MNPLARGRRCCLPPPVAAPQLPHRDTLEAVARAFGASVVERNVPYPGWAPNPRSHVLQVGRQGGGLISAPINGIDIPTSPAPLGDERSVSRGAWQGAARRRSARRTGVRTPWREIPRDGHGETMQFASFTVLSIMHAQVSFGPTIKAAHSPDERVLVTTVPPFFQVTLGVLQRLADG